MAITQGFKMINEFNQLKQLMNKEVVRYLKKRDVSEAKWHKTLDEEHLADFNLYEGILEGLSIALMTIASCEKKRD